MGCGASDEVSSGDTVSFHCTQRCWDPTWSDAILIEDQMVSLAGLTFSHNEANRISINVYPIEETANRSKKSENLLHFHKD